MPVPSTPASTDPKIARPKLAESLPLRLLGADDVPTNRDALRFMCRHLGYQIELVENGAEVLKRLETATFDLIILDIQMPVLDGLATAREICRRYPDPANRPKMVALTASIPFGDRDRCFAAGMDDYLSKPLLPELLRNCFERLFKERETPAAAAQRLRDCDPWIDPSHLQAITDGLEPEDALACMTSLRGTVISDYQSMRTRLAAACAAQQTVELAALVHGLKGCVFALGWSRMGRRCIDVVTDLRARRFSGWSELPGEFDRLFHDSTVAFDAALVALLPAAAGTAAKPQPPLEN